MGTIISPFNYELRYSTTADHLLMKSAEVRLHDLKNSAIRFVSDLIFFL